MNTKITHTHTHTNYRLKAFLMFCAVSLTTTFSFAQNSNSNPNANTQGNWRLNGNTSSTSEFIGTTNQTDLVFKSNNTEGFRLNSAAEAKFMGDVYLEKLKIISGPPKERFLQIKNDGKITSLDKSGLINAIYQPVSPCFVDQNGNVLSVWKQQPNPNYGILFTGTDCSTRVGIGTDNPAANLDVIGNARFSGILNVVTNSTQNITPFKISDINTNQDVFVIKSNGNVGVGTAIPEDKLQVGSGIAKLVVGKATGQILGHGTNYIGFNISRQEVIPNTFLWKTANDGANGGGSIIYGDVFGGLRFSTIPTVGAVNQAVQDGSVKNNTRLYIHHNGNIGIGTDKTNGFKLSVDGNIRARSIQVDATNIIWYDYVFKKDYELTSLVEVEKYINKHYHLPNVPSEKEVKENGIDLGEMDAILLRKIEELTLYMIALKKDNETLQLRVNQLEEGE